MARMIEQAGKAASAWAEPRENGEVRDNVAEPVADMVKTFSKLTRILAVRPAARARSADAAVRRLYERLGERHPARRPPRGATDDAVKPERGDKRFQDPEWGRNAFFDFLKQAYLVTSRWAADLVDHADGLDEHTRHKAGFYVKQVSNAISPSNFILTNPELFRETVASNGENLVRGMKMLAEDIAAGNGDLKLRQADYSPFEIGKNIAMTPGQGGRPQRRLPRSSSTTPSTETVLKRPLLICPPWINKFYILDLNPQKSFIRWAVEQGHTVFVISWINPGRTPRRQGLGGLYPRGPAIRARHDREGDRRTRGQRDRLLRRRHAAGGGAGAAWRRKATTASSRRPSSPRRSTSPMPATSRCSSTRTRSRRVEKSMDEKGYLDGTKMATAFNMLRSGDLIWPYVVNNYMRGKDPLPFDLLYWNADSTRMAAANHSFYLRNCYLENNLSQGTMELAGHTVSLGDITIPVYNLAAREDHIAPARSVFLGCQIFRRRGRLCDGRLRPYRRRRQSAGSQQIPVLDRRHADRRFRRMDRQRHRTPGSWWPHWQSWIEAKDNTRVPARKPGKHMKTLGDAPGTYVKVRV